VSQSDLPKISRSRKSLAKWAAALILASVAAALSFAITAPPGPGLDPDAASYLGAAQSLVRGRGYRIPISDWTTADTTSVLSHFPPGYPTAIAIPIALGVSPLNAARVINAVSVFVDVGLAMWLVASIAGMAAGIGLALALMAMPAFVEVHLSVLSEPLFLTCITAALAAMMSASQEADERSKLHRALLAGLAAAAAMLARYAGAAVVAAVALWTFWQPGTTAARLRRATAALAPSALLVGSWFLYVHLTSTVHAIRSIGAYGGVPETLRMGGATIVAWLVPLMSDQTLPGRAWIALAMSVAMAWLVRRGERIARHSPSGTLIGAATMLALCYAAVLLASRFLADPYIPFDNRLLAPLFVLVAIIVAVAMSAWWRDSRVPMRFVCAAALLAWLCASLTVSADEVSWVLENGQDFDQEQWRASPLLAWARSNAPHHPLYSNWAPAVYFHLHRTSHEIPPTGDAGVLRAFIDTLRARDGIVLLFDVPSPDQVGADTLLNAPGLTRLARVADGTVLAPAGASARR
jgi:4-amino-4-deoxy-L-arabinose transferase-like glycosyltransferase